MGSTFLQCGHHGAVNTTSVRTPSTGAATVPSVPNCGAGMPTAVSEPSEEYGGNASPTSVSSTTVPIGPTSVVAVTVDVVSTDSSVTGVSAGPSAAISPSTRSSIVAGTSSVAH